jgi:hypothetical protein
MRICINCQRRLVDADLLEFESSRMEEERTHVGLEGVCFRYYSCPRCGQDLVFLEVLHLAGETKSAYRSRKEALARSVRGLNVERTTILVVEQDT